MLGDVGSLDSYGSSTLEKRELWRMTRSDSFLVVVASHDASRSGWRIRLLCSASRNHTVCTTSSVAALPSRNDLATDHTSPANCSTNSFHADSSPSPTRGEVRPDPRTRSVDALPAAHRGGRSSCTTRVESIRPDTRHRRTRSSPSASSRAQAPITTNAAAVASSSPPTVAARASAAAGRAPARSSLWSRVISATDRSSDTGVSGAITLETPS